MTRDPVRAHYEDYPYPARDPRDERRRLVVGSPGHLLEMNHYLFAGRRDFAMPFRALVAGGGTGDGAIMLAQQLADAGSGGEVVYVDFSTAARRIAEARAAERRLANISFHTLALEDIGNAGFGRFDYVDCCGVLHHLEDPAAGLAALASALTDDGGIGAMVYGEFGRIGVYPLQAMLRALAPDDPSPERLRLARRLLGQLPATNWFKRNPFLGDHLEGGEAGLFDLLLHARDRAFRVPELAELVNSAGLRLVALVEPARYRPESYLNDPALLKLLRHRPWLEAAGFAELLAGNQRKHVFYAVKANRPDPVFASPEDWGAVPVLHEMDGPAFARSLRPGAAVTATLDGITFRFPLHKLAGAILAAIDGRRTIGDIHAVVAQPQPNLEQATFEVAFRGLYKALNGLGKLFLKAINSP